MSKLLLFSLFLFSVASFGLAATAAEKPANPASSGVTVPGLLPETSTSFDRIQTDSSPDRDHVCLNIHAFIFKTNDDRVPELVRETTCIPASRAGAKKANRNEKPKLIPGTGGNSF